MIYYLLPLASQLYTFLFQVWNSQEITADTLGMKLKTWNNFVVYFELLPGDVKDWKVFAERIGESSFFPIKG